MPSDAVVNLVVNADDAERTITVQMQRIANSAERNAPEINLRVDVDLSSIDRRLQREFGILGTRLDGALGLVNDTLRDGLRDTTRELSTALSRISDQMDNLNQGSITNIVNNFGDLDDQVRQTDTSSSRLVGTLLRVGGTAAGIASTATQFTLMSGAAAGALPVVAGLVTAVASIAPAAAAGVTAFLAIQGATATLKLGLTGVSEALEQVFALEPDAAALSEAMEHLSGNAQDFVRVLQRMRPAFDDLRLDVQDRLFRGLDTAAERTARVVFPNLRTAALQFAASLNTMGLGVASAVQELDREGTLGNVLEGAAEAFGELEDVPGQVVLALGRLASAGAPLLNRFAESIARVADNITTRLADATASGALEDAVSTAGDLLAQLGRVVGNIFGGISNILNVASESGNGLFGSLERLSQAFEDITATTAFQETLGALVDLGTQLAESVLPLIGAAFSALAPAIEILAGFLERFVSLVGDRLLLLIPELQPVLEELATAIGELLFAILPLVEEGINVLIEIMPDLVTLLRSMTQLFIDLAPIIAQLAPILAQVLIGALQATINILNVAVIALTGLARLVTSVGGVLRNLAQNVIAGVVIPALQIVTRVLQGDWAGAWAVARRVVSDFAGGATRILASFATQAVGIIRSSFVGTLLSAVRLGMSQFVVAVSNGVANALSVLRRFGSAAVSAIVGLGPALYNSGRRMISSFISGMLSQLSGVRDAANRLVSAARDFFPFSPARRGPLSGRGYTLYSGQKMIDDFSRGIISRRRGVIQAVGGVLNELPIGSTPSLLAPVSGLDSGRDFANLAGTSFSRSSPNVNVYIGNEQLTGLVQLVIDDSFQARDRLASQGVRA